MKYLILITLLLGCLSAQAQWSSKIDIASAVEEGTGSIHILESAIYQGLHHFHIICPYMELDETIDVAIRIDLRTWRGVPLSPYRDNEFYVDIPIEMIPSLADEMMKGEKFQIIVNPEFRMEPDYTFTTYLTNLKDYIKLESHVSKQQN